MKKSNLRYSAVAALSLAADQAGVNPSDLTNVDLTLDTNGLYIVSFCDNWMHYLCYIDICTKEILGFLSEPLEF
jgi:hypothetical protein